MLVLEKASWEALKGPGSACFILPNTTVFLLCLVCVQPTTDTTSCVTKPLPSIIPGKRLSFGSILVGSYGSPHPAGLVDVQC